MHKACLSALIYGQVSQACNYGQFKRALFSFDGMIWFALKTMVVDFGVYI